MHLVQQNTRTLKLTTRKRFVKYLFYSNDIDTHTDTTIF